MLYPVGMMQPGQLRWLGPKSNSSLADALGQKLTSAGAPSSNKPTEADRGHGDEPCGKLRPPRQHGVIAQQALKPFDRVD
jgi:hypothetical protein